MLFTCVYSQGRSYNNEDGSCTMVWHSATSPLPVFHTRGVKYCSTVQLMTFGLENQCTEVCTGGDWLPRSKEKQENHDGFFPVLAWRRHERRKVKAGV